MVALRRFEKDTALAPRFAKSLRQFQNLPQARLIAPESRSFYHPVSIRNLWQQAWRWITQSGESYRPASMLRRLYQGWRGGSLVAMPLEGIQLLLGGGMEERVRVEGDLATLKFPAGEGVIQVGRPSKSYLQFSSDSNSWFGHEEMVREENQVFLRTRDGGETAATWLWNRAGAKWTRVEPQQPLLLKRGMVLAFGEPPGWKEIFHIPQRAQEMEAVLVAIEGSPASDSIQVRRIRGKSLHYFLSGIHRESDLVLEKPSSDFDKAIFDALGFSNGFNVEPAALRLNAAKLLEDTGYPREALKVLEIAEFVLRQKILEFGGRSDAEDSAKASWYPGKIPEEIKLRLEMIELYERRGEILERLQEPEDAAEAYAVAVDSLEGLLSAAAAPVTQSMREWAQASQVWGIKVSLEWVSYRAHRLYYQKAERNHDQGNLADAALAYETAAKFVTWATACQSSVSYHRNHANHPVISAEVLLKKAWKDYRAAGMSHEVGRVKGKG
ncbi:MAG: hypothetical protein K8R69_07635 [Deltaproteobacteria bacterium]|nr:hypothetical protein [Deltaproteobacteria bacterium]